MIDENIMQARDKRPLYIQAISAITSMMESGKLPKGSQLPPEGELAEMLGISRSTLREALGHLETHGLVTRQQGRGTFVTAPQGEGFRGGLERIEPFRYIAEQANKKHKVVHRQVDSVIPDPEIQAELEIAVDCPLIRVQVIETIDGIRCMFLEDYLLAEKFDQKEVLNYKGSMLTYMIENRKPPLSYTRAKIFAIGASQKVASQLDVEVGQPVLQLREIYVDSVGETLGIAYLYLVTNYFYFYLTRRVIPNR
jgi:GntR family transcriptional regulator